MRERFNKLVVPGLLLAIVFSTSAQAEQAFGNVSGNELDAKPLSPDFAKRVTVLEGDILTSALNQRSLGLRESALMWEDGVVPYYFDPALHDSVVFTVEKAIATWNRLSIISLVEINPHNDNSPSDYLHFIPAEGCASWIGRQGGAQPVWTAPSCSTGSMMHEIGHALGLEHEHTRPDRDQYINVQWENISTQKTANFTVSATDKQVYGPYDYSSIMHYGEYFFSANGERTIEALQDTGVTIGQRVAPSAGDIDAIAQMYGSNVTLASSVTSLNGQTEINLAVTNESSNGANNLELQLNIGDATLIQNTSSEWQCATNGVNLICQLDTLAASAYSAFSLVLDRQRTENELAISLARQSSVSQTVNVNDLSLTAVQPLNLGAASGSDTQTGDVLYEDVAFNTGAASTGQWFSSLLCLVLASRRFARRQQCQASQTVS